MIYALCTEEVGREVVNNTIEKGCIVQLQEFIITTAKNKKPILIAVAAALLSPPLSVVGNPNNPYVDQGTPAANPGLEGPPAGQQARSSHIDGTTAVAELELGGKFNIRVKVTSRTELRSWSNAKGEGVYFWLTLADVSGAVRGTFFREAAKKFDPVVAEGKAYVFTNCQTKATSKHHPQPNVAAPMVHVHDDPCQPHLHQNDADDGLVPLELVFSNNTTIREVDDAALLAISSGQQSTAVEHVNSMAPGSIVSVLCIISQVSPVATLRNEHVKRTVDITDVTGTVPITFWDDAAHSFSMPVGTVVHFKDLRVVSYQSTVSLSFAHKSSLDGTVMFYFGGVRAIVRQSEEEMRLIIVARKCIYSCIVQVEEVVVVDCHQINSIQERLEIPDADHVIALKYDSSLNSDLAFAMEPEQVGHLTAILDRLYSFHTGEAKIPWRTGSLAMLNHKKPPGWNLNERSEKMEKLVDVEAEEQRMGMMVAEEFERVKADLKKEMAGFGVPQLEQISRDVDMYMEMLDDRDREIERLRTLRDTIFEDPRVWDDCPNCANREQQGAGKIAAQSLHSLERQIADCEHLLDHLQHSRSNAQKVGGRNMHRFSESTQIMRLRQQLADTDDKVAELRDIIVESRGCYPSNEARSDALTRVGQIRQNPDERERELGQQANDFERSLAEKDKELRLTKSIMRESFEKQVEELNRLKAGFEMYDKEIVEYLQRVFAGAAYPPGASDKQTPRELAQITADAAKHAATPVVIPEAPSIPYPEVSTEADGRMSRAWLGSNLRPLSERLGTASVSSRESRKSIL
ncbi:Replication factor A 51 kDa subunit [Diplonema papillatum]|nr:Replication factor A 51 kDa subunit [Diplonema papillatum]